jgi:hypothetical protein
MRRFAAISALLLPLPFAALPLLAIVFDHESTAPEGVVVTTQPTAGASDDSIAISTSSDADSPLAFTHGDCGDDPMAASGTLGTSGS